jgi:hypothetical protein
MKNKEKRPLHGLCCKKKKKKLVNDGECVANNNSHCYTPSFVLLFVCI